MQEKCAHYAKNGVGDLTYWMAQHAVWRYAHLIGLLVSAVVIYFAALWLTGIRLHDLLIREKQLASS